MLSGVIRRSVATAAERRNVAAGFGCSPTALSTTVLLLSADRGMKVRKEHWFSQEAVPHARRVSWAPFITPKKLGVFARLSRSSLYDKPNKSTVAEQLCEEEIETHRQHHLPDIYIYKYNVSPTHLSLRP